MTIRRAKFQQRTSVDVFTAGCQQAGIRTYIMKVWNGWEVMWADHSVVIE